jgi:large subunit ribosomal protein L19
MHPLIREVEAPYLRSDRPYFRPGDTVRVMVRIVEGNKERVQPYEGVVIGRKGGGVRETFTVRRVSFNVEMERTFQLHSPRIEEIVVVRRAKVRRAKLYFLRGRRGKSMRLVERKIGSEKLAAEAAAGDKALLSELSIEKGRQDAAAAAAAAKAPAAEEQAPEATEQA